MNTKIEHPLLTWLSNIDKTEVMEEALKALLSEKELIEISKRLEIVNLLRQGKTQREVAQLLGVGIATVSRGAKVYQSPIFDIPKKEN